MATAVGATTAPRRTPACRTCSVRKVVCVRPDPAAPCLSCTKRGLSCGQEPPDSRKLVRKPFKVLSAGTLSNQGPAADILQKNLSIALNYHLLRCYYDIVPHCSLQGIFSTARVYNKTFDGPIKRLPPSENPTQVIAAIQLAVGARYSSHSAIVGGPSLLGKGTDPSILSVLPETKTITDRRQAVTTQLAQRAIAAFEESGLAEKVTLETVLATLLLDQVDLHQARLEGLVGDRPFLDLAVKKLRKLKLQKDRVVEDQSREDVVTRCVCEVDAARAVANGVDVSISQAEARRWLPDLAEPSRLPTLNLADVPPGPTPEKMWYYLLPVFVPLANFTTLLSREAARGPIFGQDLRKFIETIWSRIDHGQVFLNHIQLQSLQLPPMKTRLETENRAIGLLKGLNFFRRSLITTEFNVHRTLTQRGNPGIDDLSQRSRTRLRSSFQVVVGMSKFIKQSNEVQQSITLHHVLLGSVDWMEAIEVREDCLDLIRIMGLSYQDCDSIRDGLRYASFMSPCAANQVDQLTKIMKRMKEEEEKGSSRSPEAITNAYPSPDSLGFWPSPVDEPALVETVDPLP
ncbi:hypothetical protein T439DRAFT_324772 [Meredithblackwellia eburnea MCA 4105]